MGPIPQSANTCINTQLFAEGLDILGRVDIGYIGGSGYNAVTREGIDFGMRRGSNCGGKFLWSEIFVEGNLTKYGNSYCSI